MLRNSNANQSSDAEDCDCMLASSRSRRLSSLLTHWQYQLKVMHASSLPAADAAACCSAHRSCAFVWHGKPQVLQAYQLSLLKLQAKQVYVGKMLVAEHAMA